MWAFSTSRGAFPKEGRAAHIPYSVGSGRRKAQMGHCMAGLLSYFAHHLITAPPFSSTPPSPPPSTSQWLVAGAREGDSLFFHYSGHGGTQADTQGDEADAQVRGPDERGKGGRRLCA